MGLRLLQRLGNLGEVTAVCQICIFFLSGNLICLLFTIIYLFATVLQGNFKSRPCKLYFIYLFCIISLYFFKIEIIQKASQIIWFSLNSLILNGSTVRNAQNKTKSFLFRYTLHQIPQCTNCKDFTNIYIKYNFEKGVSEEVVNIHLDLSKL